MRPWQNNQLTCLNDLQLISFYSRRFWIKEKVTREILVVSELPILSFFDVIIISRNSSTRQVSIFPPQNLPSNQCDQIWWNFDISAKKLSFWPFLVSIKHLAKNKLRLAKILFYLATFHNCKWPNVESIILPSGHTASNVATSAFIFGIVQRLRNYLPN